MISILIYRNPSGQYLLFQPSVRPRSGEANKSGEASRSGKANRSGKASKSGEASRSCRMQNAAQLQNVGQFCTVCAGMARYPVTQTMVWTCQDI